MDLTRLLRPRSIAVLGAGWAANVIEQTQKMGFAGQVWPVHPTRDQIGGIPAFPSLAALPSAPDATFIGVNRHATVDIVRELATMGAGGAVCFASGWTEAGEAGLQADLVAAAGAMPILGPNCYGVINYLDGALLWPDQHGGARVDRGVALLSQSSNIVINMTMQRRGLPVAYVACLGNAAQVGLATLARALLADPRVTALGMYVEGIDDAPALAALAQDARAAGKGIVCIKSGKTALAQTAAASHTAALAGGGAASSAFLSQAGIAEVATPADLLEALKILHMHGPGLGRRIASVSCSGGEAGLVADLGLPRGLDFPPVPPDRAARLRDVLGPIPTIANPLDYHTFIWGDGPRTTDVFATMLGGYDAGIFIIDPPRSDRCDPSSYDAALASIAAARAQTGKPALATALLPENMEESVARHLMAQGVTPLNGLDAAVAAIAAAQTPAGLPGWRPWVATAAADAQMLDEAAAKALLATHGVPVPLGHSAPTLATLQTPEKPFALKGLGFAHKTEAGAVRLSLTTLEGLGLRRDPVYGATLTLGFGGTEAELLADTVTLVCPVTPDQIDAALRRLRLWPRLDGHRGCPRADVPAAIRAIAAMQAMMQDRALAEIEVNPLMVRRTGAVAADAVIWRMP